MGAGNCPSSGIRGALQGQFSVCCANFRGPRESRIPVDWTAIVEGFTREIQQAPFLRIRRFEVLLFCTPELPVDQRIRVIVAHTVGLFWRQLKEAPASLSQRLSPDQSYQRLFSLQAFGSLGQRVSAGNASSMHDWLKIQCHPVTV